jgi:Peptidase family M28
MQTRARGLTRVARSTAALFLVACAVDGPNDPNSPPVPVAAPAELEALVGALAHDSLRGRRASTAESHAATAYIATLVDDYGLVPAGSGGFFHGVPGQWRTVGNGVVVVDEDSLTLWTEFVPVLPRTSNPSRAWDAQAVYAGTFTSATDPLPSGVSVTGRAVVMDVVAGGPVLVSLGPDSPLATAAVVFLVPPIPPTENMLAFAQQERLLAGAAFRSMQRAPVVLTVSREIAEQLMGQPLAGMQVGRLGGQTRGEIHVVTEAAPMRNVVAVLPGSDAAVADEYVALGAHLDHIGVQQDAGSTDSIFNGADDNASGSAALVMLARHYAAPANRPRRSLLFIWFDAEELGLFGSEAFTHAPGIPLASISAFVNLDMVSRGGAFDIDGGGPHYVQSIGSRRRSTQLGSIVDSVGGAHGMTLDYSLDAAGHEERVFCRSDQWNFARFGVPVVFLTTGLHEDYHRVDDEVERSDFNKLARVTTLVSGIVDAVASRPASLPRDLPAPDPNAVCQQ